MILRLYQFLNLIASPLLFTFIFIRLLKGKESKARLKERFGISSIKTRPLGKLIWFHATSVGEVIAILPTLNAISRDKRFHGTVLLTSTTLGSLKLLENRSLSGKIIHQLYPIDNVLTVKNFIDRHPGFTIERDGRFERFEHGCGYLMLPHRMKSTVAFAARLRRI